MPRFQLTIETHEDLNLSKDQITILNNALEQIIEEAYRRTSQMDFAIRLRQDSETGKVELDMAVG
jgi:hypothetical protein